MPAMASPSAEVLKNEANQLFSSGQFPDAIEIYTKAFEAASNDKALKAICLGNRAFAHFKLENYGSAVADATAAIELDEKYAKAYYRRGAAKFALGKYKEALRDFRKVCVLFPKDKQARSKYLSCQKEVKRIAFEAAIASEYSSPPSELIDINSIEIEDDYDGPHLPSPINRDFCLQLMDHLKNQKRLHLKYVYQILLAVLQDLKKRETLVYVTVPANEHITVCGDVHGQFYDFLNIFSLNGYPSESNPYLFNGDFVDRGSFSLEVVVALFAWKALYPNHVHLARGNHETKAMNKIYGFQAEVKAKYNDTLYELFSELFCWLPLAHCLNNKVFVCHGGLFSKDGVRLNEIAKVNRVKEPDDTGLMSELLWSDPQPLPGRAPSKRGVALSFGPDVTEEFLKANHLELVIRSHEVKPNGYEVAHNGKCVTVFSAPNYCDQMGNKGAFVRFDSQMKPVYTTFDAVPHPKIPPMAYHPGLPGLGFF